MSDPNELQCITKPPQVTPRKRRYADCDTISIDPSVVRTWIRTDTDVRNACIHVLIYRKGSENVITRYDAFSINNDGDVSFYWDHVFLTQPHGFYFGDVFINDNYCLTIRFVIRKCDTRIVGCMNEYEVNCQPVSAIGAETECSTKPCISQEVNDTIQEVSAGCDSLPTAPCDTGQACKSQYEAIGYEDE